MKRFKTPATTSPTLIVPPHKPGFSHSEQYQPRLLSNVVASFSASFPKHGSVRYPEHALQKAPSRKAPQVDNTQPLIRNATPDEIIDAMESNTIFVETSETEVLEEIMCELFTTAAEQTNPDNDRTYYEYSSRSNASSVAAQNEMKSEKAEAGLTAFKDYDYRLQCEGKTPGSADPIRVHFQQKRLRNILAVSKQRTNSADTSEFLTAPFPRIATTTAPDLHVLMQPDENASTKLSTYDMPQNALIVHAHWLNLILDGTKHGKSEVKTRHNENALL